MECLMDSKLHHFRTDVVTRYSGSLELPATLRERAGGRSEPFFLWLCDPAHESCAILAVYPLRELKSGLLSVEVLAFSAGRVAIRERTLKAMPGPVWMTAKGKGHVGDLREAG